MPSETSAETATATTYPPTEQYEQWKEQADRLDMTTSEFIQSMTEAGRKKFGVAVEPDETSQELREQRNDLKQQLEQARERIETLEERLYHGERQQIKQFLEDHPGASYAEILQHIADTLPERVNKQLEEMEGTTVRVEDGDFYPAEEVDR